MYMTHGISHAEFDSKHNLLEVMREKLAQVVAIL
jgi:hypothetical protein